MVNSQYYIILPTVLLIQIRFSPYVIAHPLTLADGSRTPSHGREYTYDLCKSCLLFLDDTVHSSYFYICASIVEVLSSNFWYSRTLLEALARHHTFLFLAEESDFSNFFGFKIVDMCSWSGTYI